jgi:ketosteroid isomerase-like protein
VSDNSTTMLEIFEAVEIRDAEAFARRCRPDVTFAWPPSLPYGTAASDLQGELDGRGDQSTGPGWSETWEPLQPTPTERAMDPQVVGAHGDDVVILWHQRGADAAGRHIDTEVLGLYRLVDGKLASAQMFYFDAAQVAEFLSAARHST